MDTTFLKGLVACLALANAGWFLWAHGIAEPVEATQPPAAKTLKLVSEAPAAAAAAAGQSSILGLGGAGSDAARDPDSAAPGGGAVRCVTVGPFRDVSEASRAASTLRSGGYDPRQRVAEGEVSAGVWVYLPSPGGPPTEQLLAKLKAAGIEDALEMPGPAEGSVISLGLFSESKRALGRLAQVQTLGLSPVLADRKRSGNVYWIDVDLRPTDGDLNPADLQADAGRISRLEVKACPATSP